MEDENVDNIKNNPNIGVNIAIQNGLSRNLPHLDIRDLKVESTKQEVRKKMPVFGCNERA